jgi:CRP/FNR family transcriptional regulator, cyclic AMP receptor protein
MTSRPSTRPGEPKSAGGLAQHVPLEHGARTPSKPEGAKLGEDSEGDEEAGPGRLQGVPWFAACTEEQLSEMARVAERLHIQSGEVILREGRLGRELFVILEGTATVTRAGRVVNILYAGDYFGELAAIEAVPRSATVVATTDLDVLIVGPREFEAMMEIPGFRNALLGGMSRRIREADDRLAAYEELGGESLDLAEGDAAAR